MFVKCNCCGRKYSAPQWNNLPDRKFWWVEPGVLAEQRVCVCGGHTSAEVPMVIIVGVNNGLFTLHSDDVKSSALPNVKALVEALVEMGFSPGNTGIMRSSSMDFPEDHGAVGLDANGILVQALQTIRAGSVKP